MSIGYFAEGFLAIQRAVDLGIVYELGGTSLANEVDVELKNFPYPPYRGDVFWVNNDKSLPVFVVWGFILHSFIICKDVILEKEKKLKVWFSLLSSFNLY